MKEFWVYTLMRLGLFLGAFLIVFGVWFAVAGEVTVWVAIVIAFLLSGIASFVLLDKQRAKFAQKVEHRARPIEEKFEAMRTREDD